MSADLLTERGVRRLIQATADIYREALDAPTIGYEMPPLMRKKLEEDIFVFSGFKTYHQLKEASLLLRNEAGGLKPFYKFYQDVTSIKEKYNRHWLRAEYNFATASAEMAAQWAAYEEVKGTTYLQYRTALDDRVRAEHAALEGVTLPLDDPFWDTAFPPNGWNCRCHVIPVPQEGHTTSNSEAARLSFRQLTEGRDSIFRFNPGKEAVLFPPHHPYYGKQGYRHCANQRLAANDDKHDPGDPCRVYRTLKEIEQEENEYSIYTTLDGAKIKVHQNADKTELDDNIRTGLCLAKAFPQLDIRVRMHVIKKNTKNPEYEIDGELADAKRVHSEEGITSGFKAAIKQGAKIVIIDFDKHCESSSISYKKVAQKIAWRKQDFENDTIENVYIVHKQNVVEIGKNECDKEKILFLLKEKGL